MCEGEGGGKGSSRCVCVSGGWGRNGDGLVVSASWLYILGGRDVRNAVGVGKVTIMATYCTVVWDDTCGLILTVFGTVTGQ